VAFWLTRTTDPGRATALLGPLEWRALETVWTRAGAVSVRELTPDFPDIAYTTLMTTLDRLYRKGLLARTKNGLAFVYLPAMDRDEYHRRVVHAALAPLLAQGAGPVMAAFVDAAAGADDDNLAELERLIAARRKRPQGG
jgi:predicted transcriptional regulator